MSVISPDILLMLWLSPAFPVGGFAYSHGLEWAVETGDVRDEATLVAWLGDIVAHGGLRNDAVLLAESFRALQNADAPVLQEANALALALSPSSERYLETAQQGGSFLQAVAAAWPNDNLLLAQKALDGVVAYPIAVGAAAGAHKIGLQRICEAYALAFIANQVSAALRLSLIGQTQAQRVLAKLAPDISALGAFAAQSSLADLGAAALRSDIASMHHETQYSRLFRS